MAASLIQTRYDVGTESAELWRVSINQTDLAGKGINLEERTLIIFYLSRNNPVNSRSVFFPFGEISAIFN